jgi:hypothetical protein
MTMADLKHGFALLGGKTILSAPMESAVPVRQTTISV